MTSSLFPDFACRFVETGDFRLFVRVGGEGPPLLLLHGFPQTHACWHKIAADLAKAHTVVCMDLPGYGQSSAPTGDKAHYCYSKRNMSAHIAHAMEMLGHDRFAVAGHDRGGRVGYRMALDARERVTRLAVLDILPTFYVWRKVDEGVFPAAHWEDLARDYPGPEEEIAKGPQTYFDTLLRRWTGDGTLDCFDPSAMKEYRAMRGVAARVHAMCEDYRAGATIDRELDEADFADESKIECPVIAISSKRFYLTSGSSRSAPTTLDVWHETFAPHAVGAEVDAGHFIMEENPIDTLAALAPFLQERP